MGMATVLCISLVQDGPLFLLFAARLDAINRTRPLLLTSGFPTTSYRVACSCKGRGAHLLSSEICRDDRRMTCFGGTDVPLLGISAGSLAHRTK